MCIRDRDWTGKEIHKKKRGFKTKKEALQWEQDFISQADGSPVSYTHLPFLVVGDCGLRMLCFINASLLMSATFSRFRNQKSDGPFDVLYYLSL